MALKLKMMNKFFLICCAYFFYELIINGLLPSFDNAETESFDPYANVIQQFYDLIIITSLLVVFRPRKWPEYFRVGLIDAAFNEDNHREIEDRRIAPLLNVDIDQKVFMSKQSKFSSCNFNSDEPVMIMNPVGPSLDD
jgi:hypothetical protein